MPSSFAALRNQDVDRHLRAVLADGELAADRDVVEIDYGRRRERQLHRLVFLGPVEEMRLRLDERAGREEDVVAARLREATDGPDLGLLRAPAAACRRG